MKLKNKYTITKAICLALAVIFWIIVIVNASKIDNSEDYTFFSSTYPELDNYEFSDRDQTSDTNLNIVYFDETTGLKTVKSYAFYWQANLTTVIFPETIETIEKDAFQRCYNLQNLVIYSSVPPTLTGDLFNSKSQNNSYTNPKPHKNFTVFVPNNSIDSYKRTSWNQYNIQPISNIQNLIDETEYALEQSNKCAALSIPFSISIIALIVIHFKECKFIAKNSTRIQELLNYNQQINFKKLKPRYSNHKKCESKREFDKTDLYDYLTSLIYREEGLYKNIINTISYNIQTFEDYKNNIRNIETRATTESCKNINYSLPYFLKRENRIFKRKTLRKPQLDVKIECTVTYTSPAGRNHYSKKSTYNYSDLKHIYNQIVAINQEHQTRQYQNKLERSKITDSLRYDILRRDNFRCQICGSTAADGVKLHVDHHMPLASKEVLTTSENLITLCDRCYRGKVTI